MRRILGEVSIRATVAFMLMLSAQRACGQIPHTVPPNTRDAFTFYDGNKLYAECIAEKDVSQNAHCYGYITGALDMIGIQQGSVDLNEQSYWKYRAICLPEHAVAQQVVDVVVRWLREHPEKRTLAAGHIVIISLIEVWACPAK